MDPQEIIIDFTKLKKKKKNTKIEKEKVKEVVN
jgi:hypothetical protein